MIPTGTPRMFGLTRDEFCKFKIGCRDGTVVPISSILPTSVCTGNAPQTTEATINSDLDNWNRAKRDAETTLDKIKQPTQWSLWLKPFMLKSK